MVSLMPSISQILMIISVQALAIQMSLLYCLMAIKEVSVLLRTWDLLVLAMKAVLDLAQVRDLVPLKDYIMKYVIWRYHFIGIS